MVDSTYAKDHQYPISVREENQAISKIKLAQVVTNESLADCKEVVSLIKNINTKLVFADRAYDTNDILSYNTVYIRNILKYNYVRC